MPDEIRRHDESVIDKALELLYQHFDCAQIFVTRQEPGGIKAKTCGGSFGFGNWYSRYGIVREWVDNGGGLDVGGDSETGDGDDT